MTDTVSPPGPTISEQSESVGGNPLEELARRLAATEPVSREQPPRPSPTGRLSRLSSELRAHYDYFVQVSEAEGDLTPAAEWLLDNFYLVQQAIRLVREDLPPGYYRELPKLSAGKLQGYPRVYALARELLVYSESHLAIDQVVRFVQAYQWHAPLTTGELWALPIMLRLSILELLADTLASVVGATDTIVRQPPAAVEIPEGASSDGVVAGCVTSLRALATHDWEAFFDAVSRVEDTLRSDPAGAYEHMDADTRAAYRRVVEELARGTGMDEEAVAREAVLMANAERRQSAPSPRYMHVGHYLVDEGREALEERVHWSPPDLVRLGRWLRGHAVSAYLGGIAFVTALTVVALLAFAARADGGFWALLAVGLLSLIPASVVAVSIVNLVVTRTVRPRILPKMDYSEGLPEHIKGIVVVPALLTSEDEVRSLLRQLEQHYLANSDPQLSFGLLTDHVDASQEEMPEDQVLVALAEEGIEVLNARHGDEDGQEPFYLFHRRRLWNEAEGRWMGWERKRGKLEEFNRLLLGHGVTSFTVLCGDLEALEGIQYVITLDADTTLSHGVAARLIGTLSHPLNRPLFRDDRVVAGYTVLQPRVELTPTSANRSRFTRIFAGDVGIDLYTRAVSDVYHDLFGEGAYVGKGIYDLHAFDRSLAGRVPENTLLSHDLFEGIHGRAGLVTDEVLYEQYPPSYLAYVLRMHRWMRGDWQLLPWLGSRVPVADGTRVPSRLSALDRWKILDNIRRSLYAPAMLLFFLGAWCLFPGSPVAWTAVGVLISATPVLTGALGALVGAFGGASLWAAAPGLAMQAARWLLSLLLVPMEAWLAVDAIVRTLLRMYRTRRHMLEWTTAAATARRLGGSSALSVTWRRMAQAPVLSAVVAGILAIAEPRSLPAAAPVLVGWFLSPQVVHWVSLPLVRRERPLAKGERSMLRRLARRTWLWYERFVGPADHWLPPDHFQEDPRGLVAHRTSPTNIGLLFLTTLAAYDLGYIGVADVVLRIRSTFEGMRDLERYRGHLLNWYETLNQQPLPPRYVSTVDNGNLAAALLTLVEGLRELPQEPTFRWERIEGLLDALGVLAELIEEIGDEGPADRVRRLEAHLDHIREHVTGTRGRPELWSPLLSELSEEDWPQLNRLLIELVEAGVASLGSAILRGLRLWTERIRYQFNSMTDEMDTLLPWLLLIEQAPLPAEGLEGAAEAAWEALVEALQGIPSLGALPEVCDRGMLRLADLRSAVEAGAMPPEEEQRLLAWCRQMEVGFGRARERAVEILAQADAIMREANEQFEAMDFGFLYDRTRDVFYLGYNVTDERMDSSHYDLLASEARTASLLAIARGHVPQRHWLHLDRPVARIQGARALLSWNGSMFEYLMPELFTRAYPGLLLEQTAQAVIDHQIAHGRRHRVPWGVSESSYYRFDANLNYQYRGFGVPGLGRKRGLEEDLVIAPYASLLALPFRPRAVVDNLRMLRQQGMLGLYGFYESVDYTRERLPLGQQRGIVKSYMVHHHSMSMLAMVNYLHDGVMTRRFHTSPLVQSVDLLLQEQIPQEAPIEEMPEHTAGGILPQRERLTASPWHVAADAPHPEAQIISNGSYSVMVTASGGGYSRWQDVDLTRWRADSTMDDWGTWLYIQDRENGALYAATRQPIAGQHIGEDVRFSSYMADFRRQIDGVSVRTEVTVAPGVDVELRRLTLTNRSGRRRRLLVASYGEVLLGAQDGDRRHPAFSKLFIDSEYLPDLDALLFRRRPRSAQQTALFLLHGLVLEPDGEATGLYETDRAAFVGRGRTVHDPEALQPEGTGYTNTAGATLDPVMSLAQEVTLEEDETVQLAYVTLAADSRPEAIALARSFQDLAAVEHAFSQAALQAERESGDRDLGTVELRRIQQLFSVLTFPYRALRAPEPTLSANRRGQPGLWPYAISGDYPILLVHIDGSEQIDLVRELLRAHAYLRHRGALFDLVVVNDRDSGYAQELQDSVQRLITRSSSSVWLNQRGGVFTLRGDLLGRPERVLLDTAARVVLWGNRGPLADQLEVLRERTPRPPLFVPTDNGTRSAEDLPAVPRPEGLLFDNTYGGFRPDGREYVIYLEGDRWTPAPWINVVANEQLGFLVSEAGAGYTWAVNSGENRLTPWSNDPVSDPAEEALYLRDEESGVVWSPTPLPAGDGAPYLVRHGAGYTVFEHHSQGIEQRLRLFVAPDAPVKIVQLRVRNRRTRARRITATYYAAWVLGAARDLSQQYVVPEYEPESGALLARNAYNEEFGARVAFLAASEGLHGLTADRTEFLGRMGRHDRPAGLQRLGLSGRVEPGVDPCAALQVHIDLQPDEEQEIYFILGQGADRHEALRLVQEFQDPAVVRDAWRDGLKRWESILSQIQVQTPDPAIDVLLNRWLLYQALSCRIWGRSALYQSSGAYGFRDQLQDVMALVHAAPSVAREQILRAARHQFEEGDVLHWWHPPSGRGVRTRFADDLLWLPYVTAHYVEATGDDSILTEREPSLVGEPLAPEEEERYGLYDVSPDEPTIYEHCLRAIRKGDTAGPHGLPLFGGGDWNDGMNRVGIEGRGESVWLGWFLYATLMRFAPLAERMGEDDVAATLRGRARELLIAMEAEAWDGEWYRRGYYDDGTPLGSHESLECQIDAIAQSWAILSGAADREDGGRTAERARRAMSVVHERLVRREDRLVLLFEPPFDRTPHDPGYIKGYPPGIRENGGQYTHAAIWTVWAFAELGEGDLAAELYRLINPVYRADTLDDVRRYRVEPYVISADVYGVPPHVGRGGWTWYTGSASWLYRLGAEGILGLRRSGDRLTVDPCIPTSWEGFTVTYRFGSATYDIRVQNPRGVSRGVSEVTLDGVAMGAEGVPLRDDGKHHAVHVFLG